MLLIHINSYRKIRYAFINEHQCLSFLYGVKRKNVPTSLASPSELDYQANKKLEFKRQ